MNTTKSCISQYHGKHKLTLFSLNSEQKLHLIYFHILGVDRMPAKQALNSRDTDKTKWKN